MLLNEFFGKAIDVSKKIDAKKDNNDNLLNNLFYYIIDHDKLYKEYFLPIAKLMIKNEGMGKKCTEEFMLMVKKGCLEFYKKNKMKGEPKKLFPKEMRDELCEKLHDHYREGIIKKEYKI
jgi:hypothetical protein